MEIACSRWMTCRDQTAATQKTKERGGGLHGEKNELNWNIFLALSLSHPQMDLIDPIVLLQHALSLSYIAIFFSPFEIIIMSNSKIWFLIDSSLLVASRRLNFPPPKYLHSSQFSISPPQFLFLRVGRL